MIGRIRGLLLEKRPGAVLVEVGGLGYEIDIPYTTFFVLPAPGANVELHTHFVVREDANLLFGFSTVRDRDLFRQLIRVSGVGPKVALALLSGMEASQLIQNITSGSVTALTRIPGIGKKTAERLIVEMRDRLKEMGEVIPLMPPQLPVSGVSLGSVRDEAIAALIALGYKPAEAARAVAAVKDEDLAVEDLIRRALKAMLRG